MKNDHSEYVQHCLPQLHSVSLKILYHLKFLTDFKELFATSSQGASKHSISMILLFFLLRQ